MNVLIVVDMQNDFITGSLGTKEAEKIVPNVAQKIKGFSGKIIYTRDTHQKDYLNTQEGKNLPVEHCIENTWGWEICDAIPVISDATMIDKPTFGSFALGDYLTKLNEQETITDIELIGLCTDICVISNAMIAKASLPEAKLVVDASCCAGVTPQTHENALEAMKICQIQVK